MVHMFGVKLSIHQWYFVKFWLKILYIDDFNCSNSFYQLQFFIQVLSSNNSHYFHNILIYSVVNTINSTYTTPISFFYVIYRFKGKRAFCDNVKIFKKRFKIVIRLGHSKLFNAIMVNSNQVIFCFVG